MFHPSDPGTPKMVPKTLKNRGSMKTFGDISRKSDKRDSKTIRKIAFSEWDLASSETLCFAEVFLVFRGGSFWSKGGQRGLLGP